ncbi:2473_t:CDS:2, partial [Gigaspora rosea]
HLPTRGRYITNSLYGKGRSWIGETQKGDVKPTRKTIANRDMKSYEAKKK